MAEITLHNIVKTYGDGYPAVNDVSLDIEDGDRWLEPAEALALATAVGVPRIVQIGCDLPGAAWARREETAHPGALERGRVSGD